MERGLHLVRSAISTRASLLHHHHHQRNTLALLHRRKASFMVQDTEDFNKRVVDSDLPVIVDFFATWCNPCRMLTPRLESVITENEGKIHLAKVDIDKNADLALDFDVGSVPVLVAMRKGKVEGRLVGLQDQDKLRKWVNDFIAQEAR